MPTKFSSVTINVAQGNTVPAIDFFDYPVFPDIGSGTIVSLYWDTPIAADNSVDYYNLSIKLFDPSLGTYITIFAGSIGNVNEYYITSDMLSSVSLSNYKLYVSIIACSKYGASYNSLETSIPVYVCKASGTYIKAESGYKQPVMKRSIAFAKLGYRVLKDEYGKVLRATTDDGGADGPILYGKASSVQDDTDGWTPMSAFYATIADGTWQASDIRYEVLTDENGEIITDQNGEYIYTL
jgi:hypothetical protein